MRDALVALGWTPAIGEAFQPYAQDHVLGRIAVEHRGAFVAYTADDELWAEISGTMRHTTDQRSDLPAAGDWVAMTPRPGDDRATIDVVLPRSSAFTRKEAGHRTQGQVLAANIDLVWIVASLTKELSARRIERYLSVAWESGAQPVVVLTKADVGDAEPSMVGEVEQVALGAELIVTSSVTGEGLAELRQSLQPHRTAALLGSSGVGKSTLVNSLIGEQLLATTATRDDAVGRHTTTRREMVRVPSGGLVIDTPGLRELFSWDEKGGMDAVFSDIEGFVARCRFTDCAHDTEPECAVRDALASGEISAARWRQYRKMQREERFLAFRKVSRKKDLANAARRRKRLGIER